MGQDSLFDIGNVQAAREPEPAKPRAADLRTVDAARAELQSRLPEGGMCCPVCDQFARVYVRKLASTAVVVLLRLWRERGTQATHMPTYLKEAGFSASYYPDVIRTKWWGLLEEVGGAAAKEGAKEPGVYRLTARGADFLGGHVTVPAHVATYNDQLWGAQPDDEIDVRGALGQKFSYEELMRDRPPAAAGQGA